MRLPRFKLPVVLEILGLCTLAFGVWQLWPSGLGLFVGLVLLVIAYGLRYNQGRERP